MFGHAGWRLGFYQDAVNSCHHFRNLKVNGVLPADLRFPARIVSLGFLPEHVGTAQQRPAGGNQRGT